MSVDNHAAFDAEVLQDVRQQLDQRLVVHAQQLPFRFRGIGQRTKDVEHGSESQLFANRADVFHRRVILLSEKEAEPRLFQSHQRLFRGQFDIDAQRLQTVRRSAL